MGSRVSSRVATVVAATMLAACGGEATPRGAASVETLGEAVFERIREADVDGALAYLLAPDDAEWIVARLEEAGEADPRRVKELRRAASPEGHEDARKDWQKIHARAEADGVVWSETAFVVVTHDVRELWPGIHGGRAYLTLRHGDAHYELRLSEACLKVRDRWLMLPEARWQGKARE